MRTKILMGPVVIIIILTATLLVKIATNDNGDTKPTKRQVLTFTSSAAHTARIKARKARIEERFGYICVGSRILHLGRMKPLDKIREEVGLK